MPSVYERRAGESSPLGAPHFRLRPRLVNGRSSIISEESGVVELIVFHLPAESGATRLEIHPNADDVRVNRPVRRGRAAIRIVSVSVLDEELLITIADTALENEKRVRCLLPKIDGAIRATGTCCKEET